MIGSGGSCRYVQLRGVYIDHFGYTLMIREWMLTQLSFQAPGIWLFLSVTTGIILALGWGWIRLERRWRVLVARWLLIPYLGLLAGGLSPRLLGLTDLDWLSSLGFGLGLVVMLLALLLIVRMSTLGQAQESDPAVPVASIQQEEAKLIGQHLATSPYLAQILASGAEEFHWSFLRAACWEMLLGLPTPPALPIYVAIWLAALLATAEILLLPATVAQRFAKLVVLATTSILFLYTRNFWLCWFLHASMWLLLNPPMAAPTHRFSAKK
jgi:hypothetical protein